jgi:hypothetical protein
MVPLIRYELGFLVCPKEKQFVELCRRPEKVVLKDIS